ncbi:hypothetical protein GUJ93_ZPchr0007g5474 [Zizania palustris]|uniref:Fungal lipase-type domain-containing protein n=1 Tax=Zizania palustris TaxID=103762 RepID=A0A8J5SLR6_ZIZPA|nr:hypothetical protein GUJ93_ZPchr0007g5474 [Zizania palustris]
MAFGITTKLHLQCSMQPAAMSRRRHAKLGHVRCAAAATTTLTSKAAVATTASARTVRSRRAPAASSASVSHMWKKVHGLEDWEGMLEPLHPVLRDEVVRYGELVRACYEALEEDRSSPKYMNCKYGKRQMLEEAGVAAAGYEVTRYIYSSSDAAVPGMEAMTSGCASWAGYVAVSTDEMTRRLGRRDVLVSFRGTVTAAEWMANLKSSLEPASFDPRDARPDVKVESGFRNVYTSTDKTCRFGCVDSCRDQLLREVSRLVASCSKTHPGEEMSITVAGHSMGGALAQLLAYDLAELGLNGDAPVTVFSFGGPRVGNAAFKARCDELGVKVLRVANAHDPVTKLPGVFLNETTTRLGPLDAMRGACYMHVGQELALDFVRFSDLGSVHDLGAYVASLKGEAAAGEVSFHHINAYAGVIAKAMEFIDRQRDAAMRVCDWFCQLA